MIKFDIITIFPDLFSNFLKESLIKKAQQKGLISINAHDLRKWAPDKHRIVDDKPYGGGNGMVMKIEPIFKAVKALKKKNSKVVLFTPRGKKFNQKIASQLSKLDQIIFICGRYEGVDERVAKNIADMELSIGDYVLMGGELPAMVVTEVITRLIPGAIGKQGLLKERKTKQGGFMEYAQYTRPEVFNKWQVPRVLVSGNHKEIEEWRAKHGRDIGK